MLSTLSCTVIVPSCLPILGDGANDVSMIQAADVGIGISGQEGMQVSLQFVSFPLPSRGLLLLNRFHSSPVLECHLKDASWHHYCRKLTCSS